MANWSTLKAAIANVIKTNGNQEITGAVLQNTLNSIVSAVGENATFASLVLLERMQLLLASLLLLQIRVFLMGLYFIWLRKLEHTAILMDYL